jgi:hypothetical protein
VVAADQRGNISRQRFGREWAGCDDQREHLRIVWNPRHFLADDADERMAGDGVGDRLREQLTIDGQRRTCGNTMLVCGPHHERSEAAHFFLEQADGVIQLVAAE